MTEPHKHDYLEQRTLVTIAHFTDLMSAQLAMTVLESAGIPAFLRNENMVRLGWAPGVGGIDLQVEPENEAAAKEILEPAGKSHSWGRRPRPARGCVTGSTQGVLR